MPLVWSPGLTVAVHQLINHSSALLDSLTIGAHASRHAEGGADALLPWNHASRHTAGGADALLPWNHASRHAAGGADAVSISPDQLTAVEVPREVVSWRTDAAVKVYWDKLNLWAGDGVFCRLYGSVGYVWGRRSELTSLVSHDNATITNIANESNIYDGNPDTYATPASDIPGSGNVELIRWDLGSLAYRFLGVDVWGTASACYVEADISSDGSAWTTIASSGNGTRATNVFYNQFRYVRVRARNGYASTQPKDYFHIHRIEAYTPMGTGPASYVYKATSDETTGFIWANNGSASTSYVMLQTYRFQV
jgi:hypothetical protein